MRPMPDHPLPFVFLAEMIVRSPVVASTDKNA
ncbi:MAG: hypothetical protein ACI9OJ_003592, partial [Myxococcota bacterium]